MTYDSTTTLNRIRAAKPCKDGWEKLLSHLGKTSADDEPLQLLTVINSNGFDDALWVLSFAMPCDRLARHFQAWCADQVLHIFENEHLGDDRVREQIAMLRNDNTTDEVRSAWYAARSAWAAAWDAAWAASRDASRSAARSAARSAWAAAQYAQEKQLRKMIEAAE